MNIGIPQNKTINKIAKRNITTGVYNSIAISVNDNMWQYIAKNVSRNVGTNTMLNTII
jgi:hypothetical protein